jgi:hypothetical protein
MLICSNISVSDALEQFFPYVIYSATMSSGNYEDEFDEWKVTPLSARSEADTRTMEGQQQTFSRQLTHLSPDSTPAIDWYGETSAYTPQMPAPLTGATSDFTARSFYSDGSWSSRAAPTASSARSYSSDGSGAGSQGTVPSYSARSTGSDGSGSGSSRTNTSASTSCMRSGSTARQKRKLQSKQGASNKGSKRTQVSEAQQGSSRLQLQRELLDKQLSKLLNKLEEDKRRRQTVSSPGADSTAVSPEPQIPPEVTTYFTNFILAYNRGSVTEMQAILDRICADNCVLRAIIVNFDDSAQPFTDREVQRQDILPYFKAIIDAFPDSYWRCEPARIRRCPLFNVVVGSYKFRCKFYCRF